MSIESYNEEQEQSPKLTEELKEDMYLRCKQKVEDAWGQISTLGSKNMSETNKSASIKAFKELFNEGAHIMVGHNMMGIDDFCDKLKNGEIDYQFLKQLDTRTRFKEGQFIKKIVPMQNGNSQIIWRRKIDSMSFKPRIGAERTDKIYGVDDIKPKSIKEKEHQQFQNAMYKTTAMYNKHNEIEGEYKDINIDNMLSLV